MKRYVVRDWPTVPNGPGGKVDLFAHAVVSLPGEN